MKQIIRTITLFYIFISIIWPPFQTYLLKVDGAGRTILMLSVLVILLNLHDLWNQKKIYFSYAFLCWVVLFCYSMACGLSLFNDSWVVIERLDENLENISTVYYGDDSDRLFCWAESITTTSDGGVLLTTQTKNISNPQQQWTAVTKIPAEAFVGIDEAHDNGLKVAIAYPNPGKDVLNIRTGLKDARVEVYDMSGRLIHNQEITDNVTTINTSYWSSGTYMWKVVVDGKEAESGKWIKD